MCTECGSHTVSRHPGFTNLIQWCWAHLLREAKYLAEHVEEVGPLSEALHELYRSLNVVSMDRPPPGEAARLAEEARRFAGKVLNGLDCWFTFLMVPGVKATNNRLRGRCGGMWFRGGSWVASGTVRAP